MSDITYFKYNDQAHELILYPENKEARTTFSYQNRSLCYAMLCTHLYQGDYAQDTITKLKNEAKKILWEE
jgi:hypothetical protein